MLSWDHKQPIVLGFRGVIPSNINTCTRTSCTEQIVPHNLSSEQHRHVHTAKPSLTTIPPLTRPQKQSKYRGGLNIKLKYRGYVINWSENNYSLSV